MSGQIWLSPTMASGVAVRGFWPDIKGQPAPPGFSGEELEKTFRQISRGQSLAKGQIPTALYHNEPYPFRDTIPAFMQSGFYFLRADAAEIVARFDLGRGSLTPARVYEQDRTTVITDLFVWDIGNAKRTIVPELSPMLNHRDQIPGTYDLPRDRENHRMVVDPACQSGPDAWIDPAISRAIFLSDTLGRALVEAGMGADFALVPVPLNRPEPDGS